MKAPGTAYDDPVLGKDPQPATWTATSTCRTTTSTTTAGCTPTPASPTTPSTWPRPPSAATPGSRPGQVWYDALTSPGLAKDIGFAGFAGATVDAATTRYGADSPAARAVREAWLAVKVLS